MRRRVHRCLGLLIGPFLLLLTSASAWAHRTSDAYLGLNRHGSQLIANLDLPLADLTDLFSLDANGDGKVTWGETLDQLPALRGYVRNRWKWIAGDRELVWEPGRTLLAEGVGGPMLRTEWTADLPAHAAEVHCDYRLLFDFNAQHRAFVLWNSDVKATTTTVLEPEHAQAVFTLAGGAVTSGFLAFLREGVGHILTGVDHLLFLLALLIPAVFRWRNESWVVVPSFGDVWPRVLAVVTAFTVAHSITLGLAVFAVFRPPSRWVESFIALSVGLAALNNLRPMFLERSWWVAAGFGLLHGFGFAGALGDLGVTGLAKALALGGFNLGVELGQLGLVALFLPLSFVFRSTSFYRVGVLRYGSLTILLTGLWWTLERSTGWSAWPF